MAVIENIYINYKEGRPGSVIQHLFSVNNQQPFT